MSWFLRALICFLIQMGSVLIAQNHPIYTFRGDLHASRLSFLAQKGFAPRVIYDIGAHKGDWSKAIKQVFPEARFYLFEANSAHVFDLERTGLTFFIALLGAQDGQNTIFYMNGSTGDSILKENTHHYIGGNYQEVSMPMVTLSSLVHTRHLPDPDLVKIDVQGAEKIIIEGGKEIIKQAEAVILETSFLEYNEGSPLVYDMFAFMEELGFIVADILEHHYLPDGELIQVDYLWLKKGSKYRKKGLLW